MDLDQARFNMVEQQIRTWDVLDQGVLDLLFKVRREEFVPEAYRNMAFVDMEIPIGHGQVMLSPKMEARILQEIKVKPADKVLEIGTGTGYMTALLAHEAKHVHSVEIDPELKSQAEAMLGAHDIQNITLEEGDGARGWDRYKPYDVIVLTGSTPILPGAFQKSLAPGGRMFAVVGEAPVMEAKLITCIAEGIYHSVNLFETCIPSLTNAQQPERFIF